MTVSSETSRKTFAGNGVTTSFDTSPMVFFDSEDLTAYVVTTATGAVVATLVENTDYTVTGGAGTTGTVSLAGGSGPYGAPPTGTTLVIVRDVAATQESDFVNNDPSDAEVVEDALDRLTMGWQQLKTRLGRALRLADSDVSGASVSIPTPAANNIFGWNAAGTALVNYVIQAGTSLVDLAASSGASLIGFIQSGANAVLRTMQSKERDVFSVKDWGVSSSESAANNTTYFSNMVSDVPAGSVCVFPSGENYQFSGQPTINKELVINADGAKLTFATNSTDQGFKITASNVHWYGGEIVGPQQAAQVTGQIGIWAEGAVSSYLTGIKIQGVRVHDFGYGGIQLRFCEGFDVSGWNQCYDNYYMGIFAMSCKKGRIEGNYIYDIDADGSLGTAAYGIAVDKNNGTEADYPVSVDVLVNDNVVYNIYTWEGIDSHGGSRIGVNGNLVVDCYTGIALVNYSLTAGSERAPTNCTVTGNTVARVALTSTNVRRGIIVQGDSSSATRANGNTVSGNTVNGYGDSSGTIGQGGSAAVEFNYTSGSDITGNTITNSGRHGILLLSATSVQVADNTIDTISGTAAVQATGAITFGVNPSDGDTITINGRAFTFRAAPSGNYEIQIGVDLATTLASAVTLLNGNGSRDGRVYLATYSANATVLTITNGAAGLLGNGFTIAASVATPSGATLSGGAAGSAGIWVGTTSGVCTGYVSNNSFNLGTQTCMQINAQDHTGLHFSYNKSIGTGTLYDLQGSSAIPNSGAGEIHGIPPVQVTYDPPNITAASSDTFYIPYVGSNSSRFGAFIYSNRNLDGLVASISAQDNYARVQLFNPSAGAVNLGNTNWIATAVKSAASVINLGP